MKILMLGWEYPPHISGGLGTACQGLTTALASKGIEIEFVVPHVFGDEKVEHMQLSSPALNDSSSPLQEAIVRIEKKTTHLKEFLTTKTTPSAETATFLEIDHQSILREVIKTSIPSLLFSPYANPDSFQEALRKLSHTELVQTGSFYSSAEHQIVKGLLPESVSEVLNYNFRSQSSSHQYGPDLFTAVDDYTVNLVSKTKGKQFDLIHAHDWMTFPAGIALSRLTGKPLVVHVHSLEFDRSGKHHNERIHKIEEAGLKEATRIIAVSYYTRSIIHREHGIPLSKISVVHNGVYAQQIKHSYEKDMAKKSKIVLFLGRITFQKGPDYFVEAAAKIIPLIPDVKFVMAGSGDMLPRLIERVAELGLSKNFIFTGFLKGKDVERMFALADLYVMPSVSEPFGIAPLEAMSHDVPVIISHQSGVSEVLQSALKVDFWDVDKMANFIAGVLRYPELRQDAIQNAREEIGRLHWGAAADKTMQIYKLALGRGR